MRWPVSRLPDLGIDAFQVAMRGLVYGSLVGGVLVVSLGSYVCLKYDVRGMEDVKMLMKKSLSPMGLTLQERLRPLKDWARGWTNRLKVCDDDL